MQPRVAKSKGANLCNLGPRVEIRDILFIYQGLHKFAPKILGLSSSLFSRRYLGNPPHWARLYSRRRGLLEGRPSRQAQSVGARHAGGRRSPPLVHIFELPQSTIRNKALLYSR